MVAKNRKLFFEKIKTNSSANGGTTLYFFSEIETQKGASLDLRPARVGAERRCAETPFKTAENAVICFPRRTC